MNKIIIKKATVDDLDAIINLNNKLFELEIKNYDDTLINNWPLTEEGKEYFYNLIVKNFVIIAIFDNITVGYLAGSINEKESYEEIRYGELNNMYVDLNYRGVGIGKLLVDNFKKYCLDNNVKNIKVTASAKNFSAIDFYKRNGFDDFNVTLTSNI